MRRPPAGPTGLFRPDLIALLRDRPMSLREAAEATRSVPKDVEAALRHLARSLKRSDYRLVVEPARCRGCGFTFSEDKLAKPGRCPLCRQTRVHAPRVRIESRRPR